MQTFAQNEDLIYLNFLYNVCEQILNLHTESHDCVMEKSECLENFFRKVILKLLYITNFKQ